MTQRFWPRVERKDWVKQAELELKGGSVAQLSQLCREGIERLPLYLAEDVDVLGLQRVIDAMDSLRHEGADPSAICNAETRSNGSTWLSRPDCSHGDAAKLHALIEAEVQRGESSVWLRFDDRQRAGEVDPDALMHREGPGCTWAAWLGFVEKMKGATGNIGRTDHQDDSDSLHLVLDLGVLEAMDGYEMDPKSWPSSVRVTTLFDPLAAMATWGGLAQPIDDVWDRWIQTQSSNAQSRYESCLGISAVDYYEAGATSVDQLAFSLATAVDDLRQLERRGQRFEQYTSKMTFQFAIGRDFFGEIAKLRAIRVLWFRIAAACGVVDPANIRIHARSSLREQTSDDPWNNVLRGTLSCLAATLAGVDSLTILPFDMLAGGSENGRRLAANTQTILRRESGLGGVKDPFRGSFFLESLTDQMARAAWEKFQAIESAGGMQAVLESGQVRDELALTATKLQSEVASGKRVVVGVNRYVNPGGDQLTRRYPVVKRPDRAIQSIQAIQAINPTGGLK